MTTQSARVGGVTIATAVGVRASETRLRATTPLLGMYPQRSREIQVGQRKSPNGWYAEKDHLGAALASGDFDGDGLSDLAISTNPETLSEGMFSWFPLYMPLRHPVLVLLRGGRGRGRPIALGRGGSPDTTYVQHQLETALLW